MLLTGPVIAKALWELTALQLWGLRPPSYWQFVGLALLGSYLTSGLTVLFNVFTGLFTTVVGTKN